MPTTEGLPKVGGDQVEAENATFVSSAKHVNAGSGPQNNYTVLGENLLSDAFLENLRKAARRHELAEVSLEWHSERFVKPDRYLRAKQMLGDYRVVLVSGDRGSGRRTASKMLLREVSGERPREIPADTEEDRKDFLRSGMVGEAERLLLDLSADIEFRLLSDSRSLEPFIAAVEKEKAYMVVVLPPDAQNRLASDLLPRLVSIERPGGREVLESHLGAAGFPLSERDLDVQGLDEFLAEAPVGEIGRLCQGCLDLHDRETGNSIADCLAEALQTVSKRAQDIGEAIRAKSPSDRALVLSAGFLEGAHADVVVDSAEKLLALTGTDETAERVLACDSVDQRLKDNDFNLSPSREVFFSKPSAEGVVRYFWDAFPRLRPILVEWVGRCLTSRMLTDLDRTRLVRRIAIVCRQGRHGGDLCVLAAWLLDLDPKHRPLRAGELAVRILTEGLEEDPGALAVRRKMYAWADNESLSPDLARVLIVVCSEVLARTHPEQALVRLRHLARNKNVEVGNAAGEALLGLIADDRLFLDLLWRLGTSPLQSEADAALFLRIVEPSRLLEGSRLLDFGGVRGRLTDGWTRIVERPRVFWSKAARDWFDAFLKDASAEPLLDVLVDAASEAGHPGRLHVVLRDWAHEPSAGAPETRRRTAALVRKKIDEAQLAHDSGERVVDR